MNNNLNNNIATNNISGGVQPSALSSGSVIQPVQVATTTVQPMQTVSTAPVAQVYATYPAGAIPVQPSLSTNKNDTNTFLIVGLFVGFVLLASIFLLVLLVTGVIGNRNRLTCTKTINEDGYTHFVERYYTLKKGVYTKVENTDIYTYPVLTDNIYNEKFLPIDEIKSGVTEYGFGTQVKREGNGVTITSYNPNFFGYKIEKVKNDNAKEGFTCK